MPFTLDMRSVSRVSGLLLLAGFLASCDSSVTPPNTAPSPTQTPAPTTPQPPVPETTFVMSGYVRDQLTSATIANARLEIVQGINAGKIAWSDSGGLYRFEQLKAGATRVRVTATDYETRESDISISVDETVNVQLTPVMPYVYSGIVTDGMGRPVVGAAVRGGPNSGATDANGRYEFRSPYSSVPGNVYPPAGYERKPVRATESFVLTPGQNLTIRRITDLTINTAATLTAGDRSSVSGRVTFDTGQVENAVDDVFEIVSSDTSILRPTSVYGFGVEAVKAGTVSVTARYFGVTSSAKQVQVVPR